MADDNNLKTATSTMQKIHKTKKMDLLKTAAEDAEMTQKTQDVTTIQAESTYAGLVSAATCLPNNQNIPDSEKEIEIAVDSLKENEDEKKKKKEKSSLDSKEDGSGEEGVKKTSKIKAQAKDKKAPGKKKEKGNEDKVESTEEGLEIKKPRTKKAKRASGQSPVKDKLDKEKISPKQKEFGSPNIKPKDGPSPRGAKQGGTVEEDRFPSKERVPNKKERRGTSGDKVVAAPKKPSQLERQDPLNKKKNSATAESPRSPEPAKKPMKPPAMQENIKAPEKKKEKKDLKDPREQASGPLQKGSMRKGKPEANVDEKQAPMKKEAKKAQSKRKAGLFAKIRGGARSRHVTWAGRAGAKALKKTGEERKSDRKSGTGIDGREFFCPAKVTVKVESNWNNLDVDFSYGMVVRSVGKSSPLLDYLIPGDQLIGIGNMVSENYTVPFEPNNLEEALRQSKGGQITLTVVRPVGMMHLARKMSKRKDDHLYFIAELPSSFKSSDLSLGVVNGRAFVTRAEGTLSGVLMKDDRIMEFDGRQILKGNKQEALDQMVDKCQRKQASKEQAPVTCLVMRPLEHRLFTGFNVINSRLMAAVNAKSQPSEPTMGDDAREIGAREACRFRHWKNYEITTQSIVTTSKGGPVAEKEGTLEEGVGKDKQKKGKKKGNKCAKRDVSPTSSPQRRANCKNVTCGKNQKKETSTTPTDVQDVSTLMRVTPGVSGLDKFRSFFHMN